MPDITEDELEALGAEVEWKAERKAAVERGEAYSFCSCEDFYDTLFS